MSIVLSCDNLTKRYGRTYALRDLDIQLEENVIYGLLGRNGAGKTTLLNLIAGGLFANDGTIVARGKKLGKGALPEDCCFVRENNKLFGGARLMEILQFAAHFHPHWDWTFAHKLLHTFRLDPSQKIKQLSRGTESLVGNIIGLSSRASLTLFDEPVLGLDVLMREKFYKELLEDYAEHPRTIVVSTHLIDEIAPIAERVYILDEGSLLLHDDMNQIRTAAYLIRGNSEAMASFTKGKRVLHTESYGHGKLAAIYDKLADEDRLQARKLDIAIESLSLQKFFSYLIEGGR
ncbi:MULTISPECIES: ABC transporter ATP-binding protein [unclassified Paenibacillus]|uniref:ATP-binding cassette domain-containing protein n=1 Tax=unclassified Paenibacillus TaxID=185978 RepID=UPI0009541D4E|nr:MULTISPECIES: ABC transporter ATP-binding protein [unclassified Paenibacillus]ASS64918.1 ABC transporter ATP-binding protein [Paenibacillus sp. RUD330]SIR01543.1 ABC-2 type transport system ATP-binding protein [Paenibacillus sp. RU4X]SIR33569.1 ABC-2 type transport system ATP-binding protein [Paenibacillus sp. RU4T]